MNAKKSSDTKALIEWAVALGVEKRVAEYCVAHHHDSVRRCYDSFHNSLEDMAVLDRFSRSVLGIDDDDK